MNMNINTIHIQVHADEQHTLGREEEGIEKGLKSISTHKNVAFDCRGTQGFVPSQNMSSALLFCFQFLANTHIMWESTV